MAKKLIGRFNAVIEGTFHDEWTRFNYKIVQIDVPVRTSVINDVTYKYGLAAVARTKDFQSVIETSEIAEEREVKIDSLGFCNGVVLPYRGGIPNLLERPRTVFMRDGRIFVERHMRGMKDI